MLTELLNITYCTLFPNLEKDATMKSHGNKTILVTGGAGFIGSYTNFLLHKAGYDTVVFDNLSSGHKNAVVAGKLVVGDLREKGAVEDLFAGRKFDAVVHFAAFIDAGESCRRPQEYYHNNVLGTLNLLQAMHHHDVKTFLFSSSAAVYGTPQQTPITEGHPCLPINPYGNTKLVVEGILKDFATAYGLRYGALRYFNAAGGDPDNVLKNYKTKEHNLVPAALRTLLNGGTLTVFGTDYPTPDGTCIRDYIHIHDLATAHVLALQGLFQGMQSDVFNLGNGQGYTVQEVLNTVEKVTGQILNVVRGPRRPGDPPALVADATKASKVLGWRPQYPDLETIVRHAWLALQGQSGLDHDIKDKGPKGSL